MTEDRIKELKNLYEPYKTFPNCFVGLDKENTALKAFPECLEEIERLREIITEIQDFLSEEGFFNRAKELARDLDDASV